MNKRKTQNRIVDDFDSFKSSEEFSPPRKKIRAYKRSNDVSAEKVVKINKEHEGAQNETNGLLRVPGLEVVQFPWNTYELLSEQQGLDIGIAKNVVQLFEQDNTIPFICRYRRDLINNMTPEKLRNVKKSYVEILNLRKRAKSLVSLLEKHNQITMNVREELLGAKSNEELELLFAPHKPANKGSLADRAKILGLEQYANRILFGLAPKIDIDQLVQLDKDNLDTREKVECGIRHIIAHNICKHTHVLEQLRTLKTKHIILLNCTQAKSIRKSTEGSMEKSKYKNYFDYQNDVRNLKPHQILAINRGEKQNFLNVKITPTHKYQLELKIFVRNIFMRQGLQYNTRSQFFHQSYKYCYSKKLLPLLTRQIRAELTELATNSSIDVFAKNVKQLLLTPPLKGKVILGIDPGLKNGCKLALISETAMVLETAVIYPHTRSFEFGTRDKEAAQKLCDMIRKHKCTVIAIGNGTACRKTELWLSKLFDEGMLDRKCVRYTIVSEHGASIYSCSDVAKREFPHMDVNEISAVSIARRLNDPLSEYVKIEPRHIGVGMYQHDISEKMLSESLAEVVSECVSYVGVDINTGSLSLLKHIAGLTEKKAEEIIKHRSTKGIFQTRRGLLDVKSIGIKTYTQCAGFLRIEPRCLGVDNIENPLDCTWVHPESYNAATKIIERCDLKLMDIGTPDFIKRIRYFILDSNYRILSEELKIPEQRLSIILEALKQPLGEDIRKDTENTPLFRQEITQSTQLSVGTVLTGCVNNVTHFGAFVDIGIECNGLIHIRQMNQANTLLNIGDRVTVSILKIDLQRKRIALKIEENT